MKSAKLRTIAPATVLTVLAGLVFLQTAAGQQRPIKLEDILVGKASAAARCPKTGSGSPISSSRSKATGNWCCEARRPRKSRGSHRRTPARAPDARRGRPAAAARRRFFLLRREMARLPRLSDAEGGRKATEAKEADPDQTRAGEHRHRGQDRDRQGAGIRLFRGESRLGRLPQVRGGHAGARSAVGFGPDPDGSGFRKPGQHRERFRVCVQQAGGRPGVDRRRPGQNRQRAAGAQHEKRHGDRAGQR